MLVLTILAPLCFPSNSQNNADNTRNPHCTIASLVLSVLSHCVQGATILEPFILPFVECMGKLDIKGLSILGMHAQRNWLANSKFSAQQIHLVIRLNLVIVFRIAKGER